MYNATEEMYFHRIWGIFIPSETQQPIEKQFCTFMVEKLAAI